MRTNYLLQKCLTSFLGNIVINKMLFKGRSAVFIFLRLLCSSVCDFLLMISRLLVEEKH